MQKELEHAFEMMEHGNSVKEAENIVNRLRKNIDYPMWLLVVMDETPNINGKLKAAIQLRIWCDAYKGMEEFQRNQFAGMIENVKEKIMMSFLHFTDKIQKTLMPAIVSLSVVEYPDRWPALVPGLITCCMKNQDCLLKSLELMSEITHKYEYQLRSDPLWSEINYTCANFHNFLLTVTRNSIENIFQNQSIYSIKVLEQEMILFFHLNCQDLPPDFQDNLPEWMSILNRVMKLPDTNEHYFKCKGACLQAILLYASKYKEDVEESIKGFSEQIWSLCANALPDSEYDEIVLNALKYFRSLVLWKDMKQFFAENISNLVTNLILPNLGFTDSYKSLFHEEIETFIGYYFRNTEISSRRSSALELLQALVRNYNAQFQQFLTQQLSSFDGHDNIQNLCLLLTLVIESAPKAFRDIDGSTQLHIDFNIITYCYENFVKNMLHKIFNLNSENKEKPIERKTNIIEVITTLRFIFYFRTFLPQNDLILILQLCCGLYTENDSLKQILILMVNAIIIIRHGNFTMYKDLIPYFNEDNVKQVTPDILQFLAARNNDDSTLNEAVTKVFHALMKTLKASSVEFYQYLISPLLISMLQKTDQYNFNAVLHLFQGIGFVAFWLCKCKSPQTTNLQTLLQQYFHKIIQKDSDVINFCFQILSIFLQLNQTGNKSFYDNLYLSVITLDNWREQNLTIMSSYIQYISAYMAIHSERILGDKNVYEQILGRLIQLDHFDLFCRLVKSVLRVSGIENFYHWGYMEVVVKGTQFIAGKSIQGRKTGLCFIFEIMNDYSADTVVKCLNSIRECFFQQLILANEDIIQTLQVFKTRKIMFSAICNALATSSFSSVQVQATVFDLLVENCLGRFKREKFALNTQASVGKKEATYQKLTVFKEIEQIPTENKVDEEILLIQAFQHCNGKNSNLGNTVSKKTVERMQRLFDKHQNSN